MEFSSKSVVANFIWRLAERFGAQLVTFVVSIILARLLEPTAYGTVALLNVFVTILAVFVEAGLGSALIQKKDADDLDFSSIFYANVLICIVLYILLFFAAPIIAEFYNNMDLVSMIRVLGITLLISGVKNVQSAYVSKNMLFKRFFFATLGGTIGAAVMGIGMAYAGLGAWAIIAQSLFNNAMDTFILWITVKWRPKKMFSFRRLKVLFSYGWKLVMASLLETVYTNLRSLIIGKKYTSENLAYYTKSESLIAMLISNINSTINSVIFPVMSYAQDDAEEIKRITKRSMKTSIYVIAPMMMGVCFVATSLINFLLGEKWLPCVPFIRVFCITYMFYPLHTANLNAVKAMGRSDLFLKLEIIKKVIGIIALVTTMHWGVMVMAYSLLFTSVSSQIINSWPNKKLLNYPYLEQLKDVFPSILLAIFMGGCVRLVALLHLPDIVTLLIQVPLGVVIYIGLSKVFRLDSFEYLWGIVKPTIHKISRKKAKFHGGEVKV